MKKTKPDEKQKAIDYAIKLISYRERSSYEITSRLKRKGYDPPLISEVIKILQDKKYIDDKRFSVMWAEYRLRTGKYAWKRIASELKQKGIDQEDIEFAKSKVYKDINEEKLAFDLVEKFRKDKINDIQTRRLASYLRRRGFNYTTIAKVVASFTIQDI